MHRRWLLLLTLLVLVAIACAMRVPSLALRPMHADEAVHAFKLDELITQGRFVYDPHDYHGPTLYYATLPVVWATGATNIQALEETHLRLVTLAFGVALVPLIFLLRPWLGRVATICAAVLLAISPAMVFYSGYYIQEMLLVFFTLAAIACGMRYAHSHGKPWAFGGAVAIALAAATKETWVLSAAAAVPAVLAAMWASRRYPVAVTSPARPSEDTGNTSPPVLDYAVSAPTRYQKLGFALLLVLVAFVVWAAAISAGFTQPRSIGEGFRSYLLYLQRNESAVEHHQPWYYYLQLMTWWRPAPGPVWSEGLIIPLAVVGLIAAATGYGLHHARRPLAVFIAVFTVVLILEYAWVAYKTPWCLLSFLLGMIVLAGIGVSALTSLLHRWRLAVAAVAVLLGYAAVNLIVQTYWVTVKLPTDRRNPYVYAGTLRGVEDLARYVASLQSIDPELRIYVDATSTWPLPWYLRRARVMYEGTTLSIWGPAGPGAPQDFHVIIRNGESPADMADLGFSLDIYPLRPDKRLAVYTRDDVLDRFQQTRSQENRR